MEDLQSSFGLQLHPQSAIFPLCLFLCKLSYVRQSVVNTQSNVLAVCKAGYPIIGSAWKDVIVPLCQ